MKNGSLNLSTLASQLKHCGKTKALLEGKRLHRIIEAHGYDSHTFLGNWLVQMYGDCGSPMAAQQAFNRISNPNMYSWNILINAHGQNDNLQEATRIFRSLPYRDVVSWNAIITAYAQYGHGLEALYLFSEMQVDCIKPVNISYVSALNAAAGLAALSEGEAIFAAVAQSEHWNNAVVCNAVINMYGKCGYMNEAQCVFDNMPFWNSISWTTLISAYNQNKQAENAINLFYQMVEQGFRPEAVSYGCAIDACTGISVFLDGLGLHAAVICCGYEGDTMVGSALVHFYAKFGMIDEGVDSFCEIHSHNVVSWTSVISACTYGKSFIQAIFLFYLMMVEGVKPDRVTFICVLEACAGVGALERPKEISHTIVYCRYENTVEIGNALIDMYGKCGSLDDAKRVFSGMQVHDVVSWNAMIACCAHNGQDYEALSYFWQMQYTSIKPNSVTFVSALNACSHSGLVDVGWEFFFYVQLQDNFRPLIDHSGCMVDLFGRSGLLDEAEALMHTIAADKAASVAWLSLISACRLHGDIERGLRLAQYCIESDPKNIAAYKILSNIQAAK